MIHVDTKSGKMNEQKETSCNNPVEAVVSCELLTDAMMKEKIRPIIEYIKEGDPDIKVVLSELEEIASRSTGDYFKYNRFNSN